MSVNTIQAQIDSLKAHQKADEKKLRKAREDALQQAWLVNKQQTRMLPQQLSAQGANGGAVQSSFVSQNNEYQRNRRGAESDYANNLADSRLKYSDKFAQLLHSWLMHRKRQREQRQRVGADTTAVVDQDRATASKHGTRATTALRYRRMHGTHRSSQLLRQRRIIFIRIAMDHSA